MLAIGPKGDKLSVRVTPIPSEKDAPIAMSQPLDLLGTPEELDAEFAAILTSYSASRKTLQQSLDDATTLMKAAATQASKQSVAAVAKVPAGQAGQPVKPAVPEPAPPTAAPQNGEVDDLTLNLF